MKADLDKIARGLGAFGTCMNCHKENVPIVMYFDRKTWCIPCRNKDVAALPPLPDRVKDPRPEIKVTYDDKVYTFTSKAEARRTMRRLLSCERLPPEVATQISGARGRRASQSRKGKATMPDLTKKQMDDAAKALKGGSTLQAEAVKLGFTRGKPLRVALQAHIGAAAYAELVPRGRKAGATNSKKKAAPKKKAAAKKTRKAAAKKKAAPKKKADKSTKSARKPAEAAADAPA